MLAHSRQDNDHTTYTYNTANHLLTGIRQPKYYGDTTTSPVPAMSMIYDSSERVISQTDATGHTTTFAFGPSSGPSLTAGQTLVTDPNGNVETYSYDDQGNKISASNGLGYTTAFTYNAMDELTAAVDPLGVKTTYGYDEAGHIAVAGGTNSGTLTFGVPTSQTVTQLQPSAEISDLNPGAMPSRTTGYYKRSKPNAPFNALRSVPPECAGPPPGTAGPGCARELLVLPAGRPGYQEPPAPRLRRRQGR